MSSRRAVLAGAVDHVLNTPDLDEAAQLAILGGNAARMLGLPPG